MLNSKSAKVYVRYQKIVIQSAKNTKSSKTAKPDKTEEKINHVSIFPFRKQTCTVTQHTGDGEGWGRAAEAIFLNLKS